jgi:hypothetical protein
MSAPTARDAGCANNPQPAAALAETLSSKLFGLVSLALLGEQKLSNHKLWPLAKE